MNALRQWLTGAAAASLLSAAALALCPKGRVRNILKLVCGLMCALALAAPVTELDPGELAASLAAYGQAGQRITENAEEERKTMERAYIEERCAAYISDRAAALGSKVTAVSVLARWSERDGVWYPWSAKLTGAYDPALSRAVEEGLGIPAGRQTWTGP